MTMKKFLAALVVGLAGSILFPASAATVLQSSISHGVGNCRGPRVGDESQLYRSANGVRNDGNTAVFVTCDFDQGPNWPNYENVTGIAAITIAFLNGTTKNASLSCTLADGILHVNEYVTKSVVVQGRPQNYAAVPTWTADADNEGMLFAAPSVTCSLPPGIEISYVLVRSYQEVGQ